MKTLSQRLSFLSRLKLLIYNYLVKFKFLCDQSNRIRKSMRSSNSPQIPLIFHDKRKSFYVLLAFTSQMLRGRGVGHYFRRPMFYPLNYRSKGCIYRANKFSNQTHQKIRCQIMSPLNQSDSLQEVEMISPKLLYMSLTLSSY